MAARRWRKLAILHKIETVYATDSAPAVANAIVATNVSITPIEADEVARDLMLPYMGNQGVILDGQHAKIEFEVEIAGGGDRGLGFGLGRVEDPVFGGSAQLGFGSNPGNGTRDPRFRPSVPPGATGSGAGTGGGGGGGRSPLDEGLREARQLYEETRSSAEKYAEGVERVNKLHQLFPEIVTSDVKGRALDKLKEDYTDLGRLGQEAAGAIRNAFAGIFDDPARALKNLAAELAQMALFRQMAGWFPSMFGAQGAVPLLSRAGGGPIHGPGTSTSDSILMWASNGEYMVNAASSAAYRPILEVINADKTGRLMDSLPRRAAGGIIGQPPGARRGGGMAPGGAPSVSVKVENYTGQPAREERGTGPDGEEMIAIVVGKQMARGKYDRSNRARYGERPDPVRR